MSAVVASLESVLSRPAEDEGDIWHSVCHCTDDNLSACGLDVTDEPWEDGTDDRCPLCVLAWPYDALTCPWGCSCEDCGATA